ncbi:ethanolamine ammonia-lyase subunit EutC [Edaphobacter modestus]|uniref:Ethanolamine ammonia-lyase small subunit n=1 Tax=Edaphobacter modestus TaxID=388466 RepID=A0A4Q7YQT4_9BACT|nr:ethanolamine ammonia-lyase subunit EutC [Edaphobacter modestus]RZU39243.1 ethanolamine ammonia-lyase light chain [Edaphobacter modestus]
MTNAMSRLIKTPRSSLRELTPARVSLHTTGDSIATDEVLNFELAHAQARDAVHAVLHLPSFAQRLLAELPILGQASIAVLQVRSNASDRAAYLRQPNLGRTLHPDSVALLRPASCELAITIADGLSALAIERNAIPVLALLLPKLLADAWTIAPITLVQQGRVGISDSIGSHLGASLSVILIGERPGLSSPDSMGAYLTWSPHPDRTDADRNCLSNIRSGGLSPEAAADRLFWYLKLARLMRQTGTSLKEGSPELNLVAGTV